MAVVGLLFLPIGWFATRRRQRCKRAALVCGVGGLITFSIGGGLVLVGVDYQVADPLIATVAMLLLVASLIDVVRPLRTFPPPSVPNRPDMS